MDTPRSLFVESAAMSLGELSISGSVVRPGEADWDAARMAWNLAADQHPEAVVLVESAEDVAEAVRFAAGHGLKVAAQGPTT
jgi:FAD/FMN-containing dehydrogenase